MLDVARHQHAHEVPAFLIAVLASDNDLIDVLRVEIADRTLGERAFLVDELWRGRFQRQIAYGFPEAQQVFEIAFDFGLGAAGAGGAQDHAHARRRLQFLRDVFQACPIFRGGDLARNAAAARGIGHQHRIASGEREIGGKRCAFGSALFLDHLHQHHLAALDHLLNLVLAAEARHALLRLLERIGTADRFDCVLFAVLLAIARLGLAVTVLGLRGLGGGQQMVAGFAMVIAGCRHV